MPFFVSSDKVSKRDLEAFLKERDPSAEVLEDGQDCVLAAATPRDVRIAAADYLGDQAADIGDKECMDFLQDEFMNDIPSRFETIVQYCCDEGILKAGSLSNSNQDDPVRQEMDGSSIFRSGR